MTIACNIVCRLRGCGGKEGGVGGGGCTHPSTVFALWRWRKRPFHALAWPSRAIEYVARGRGPSDVEKEGGVYGGWRTHPIVAFDLWLGAALYGWHWGMRQSISFAVVTQQSIGGYAGRGRGQLRRMNGRNWGYAPDCVLQPWVQESSLGADAAIRGGGMGRIGGTRVRTGTR